MASEHHLQENVTTLVPLCMNGDAIFSTLILLTHTETDSLYIQSLLEQCFILKRSVGVVV